MRRKKYGDIFVNIKICNILMVLWGIKILCGFFRNISYVSDFIDNLPKYLSRGIKTSFSFSFGSYGSLFSFYSKSSNLDSKQCEA